MIPTAGDRIRVTAPLVDEPDTSMVGAEGTVVAVHNQGTMMEQIEVTWDNGRRLYLLPEDPYEVVDAG